MGKNMHARQVADLKRKSYWYQFSLWTLLIFLLLPLDALLWYLPLPKGYEVLIAVAMAGMVVICLAFWFLLALINHTPFQFSIRSLLLLITAVAIPLSWLAAETEWARKQKNTVAALRDHGGYVRYSHAYYEFDPTYNDMRKPAAPEWLENMLGTDFFDTVDYVELEGQKFTDADLENVKHIRNLRLLRLWKTKVTDAGINKLRKASPKVYIDIRTQ